MVEGLGKEYLITYIYKYIVCIKSSFLNLLLIKLVHIINNLKLYDHWKNKKTSGVDIK